MRRKLKIISLFLIYLFFFQTALAHSSITPERLANSVRNFLENAIRVGVVLAFFSLVYAGFLYLSSAGRIEQIVKAKKQIFGTFVGLILLLGSWLFLGLFRPEFRGLSPAQVPQSPPDVPPSLERPEGAYMAFAEIPIETFLKGEEKPNVKVGENSQYFNLDELREVKNFLENDFLPLINEIEKKFKELEDIVHQRCSCSNAKPEGGRRSCSRDQEDPNICPEVQEEDCEAKRCIGDPCKEAREEMGEKMAEIASSFSELFEKTNELRKKILSIKERMAKLSFALKMMKDCPFDSIFSRDVFVFTTDYLQKKAPGVSWQVSRVPLFEGIKNPRSNSFVDFYCPKTGFYYLSPSPDQTVEAIVKFWGVSDLSELSQGIGGWEEIFTEAEQATSVSPEYQLNISCPFSIPFGEMMEKFLEILGEIIKQLEGIVDSPSILPPKINDYYQLTFECKPENCSPFCRCVSDCTCRCSCTGSSCPLMLIIQSALIHFDFSGIKDRIKKINFSQIEKWLNDWEKIEKEVRKRETPLTKQGIENLYQKFPNSPEIVAFEIMASRMHYCLAHAMEVEAGWMLSPCDEYKEGCLAPDGKKVESIEDCKCEKSQECRNSYPVLHSYKCEYLAPAFWLAKLFKFDTDKCHLFNYFCCRPFERK